LKRERMGQKEGEVEEKEYIKTLDGFWVMELEIKDGAQHWWLTPVIAATQEAEIRIEKIVQDPISKKIIAKEG
jgi:hypothetical protein